MYQPRRSINLRTYRYDGIKEANNTLIIVLIGVHSNSPGGGGGNLFEAILKNHVSYHIIYYPVFYNYKNVES